jgi:hypothetical protein
LKKLPDFLIIGGEKCGTSFVHHCLREHSDVFMPLAETAFFEDPDFSPGDFSPLEKLFAAACHEQCLGIKRPAYLHKPECPARLRHYVPQARMIVILRDPVERAVSAYYHNIKMGFIPIADINKNLDKIIDGKVQSKYQRASEIIECGFYHEHIRRYLMYFPREQMMVVLYDDLKRSPRDTLKKLFKFLEIEENVTPISLGKKVNVGTYSLLRLRLTRLQNPIVYSYNKACTRLYAKKHFNIIQTSIARLISWNDTLLSYVTPNSQPVLTKKLQERLSDIYREDSMQLQELLGVNLSGWSPLRF